MKTSTAKLILAAALAAFACFSFTGCQVATPQDTASTIKVSSAMGKSVDVALPKNLEAEGLEVVVNPATGEYRLTATKIRTDASTVLDTAANANAAATASAAAAVQAIVERIPINPITP